MANRLENQFRYTLVREVADRWLQTPVMPGAFNPDTWTITFNNSQSGTCTLTVNGVTVTAAMVGVLATDAAALNTAIQASFGANTVGSYIISTVAAGAVTVTNRGAPITIAATSGGTPPVVVNNGPQTAVLGYPIGAASAVVTLSSGSGVVSFSLAGFTASTTWATSDTVTGGVLANLFNAGGLSSTYTAYAKAGVITIFQNVLPSISTTAQGLATVSVAGTGMVVTTQLAMTWPSYPKNKGIQGIYQLNTGFYMPVLTDTFANLLNLDYQFLDATSAAPAVDFITTRQDNVQSRATGYILFSTVVATNTVVINGTVFECVPSGATGNQFNVGANDGAAATNLAAAINGSVTVGIKGVVTASAVLLAASAGAVLVKSTQSNVGWNVGSTAKTAGSTKLFPLVSLANGPGPVFVAWNPAGTTPTDPSTTQVVKLDFTVSNKE